ncbi:MAG: cytochrome P450 [Polyangiales bacterium]|nr:cytochrome P450 [Sandaracinaceae bacterium]
MSSAPRHHVHRHLPAGPRAPRLKQLQWLAEDPHGLYRRNYEEFGPMFTLQVMAYPWVILGDADLLREVFRGTSDDFHSDADGIKFLLGPEALLFMNGAQHRAERKVMQPPFKKTRVDDYAAGMLRNASEAVGTLRAGETVHAQHFFADITLRTIIECVFGITDEARAARLHDLFGFSMRTMQRPAVGALSMTVGGARVRAAIKAGTDLSRARYGKPARPARTTLGKLFDARREVLDIIGIELAAARKTAPGDRLDVLAELVHARYEDGSQMSDAAILDELNMLLIGGHDTSAITMSWVLYYLAQDLSEGGKVTARVRNELSEAFGDGPVDPAAVHRLTYLQAVIDEVSRLRPVANAVSRRLTRPMVLGDFALPEGTVVLPSPTIMHYREDIWPDPERFDPERFLGTRPSPFHFLPFGGGSRACLGRPFAATQMRVVLAEVLRRVDFARLPGTTTKDAMNGVLIGPNDAVPLAITNVRTPTRARRAA